MRTLNFFSQKAKLDEMLVAVHFSEEQFQKKMYGDKQDQGSENNQRRFFLT